MSHHPYNLDCPLNQSAFSGVHAECECPAFTYAEANAVIRKLTAIDGYDEQKILDAVNGIGYDLFQQLDEKPGYYDGDYAGGNWHWKLRRARNSASIFFETINSKEDR